MITIVNKINIIAHNQLTEHRIQTRCSCWYTHAPTSFDEWNPSHYSKRSVYNDNWLKILKMYAWPRQIPISFLTKTVYCHTIWIKAITRFVHHDSKHKTFCHTKFDIVKFLCKNRFLPISGVDPDLEASFWSTIQWT